MTQEHNWSDKDPNTMFTFRPGQRFKVIHHSALHPCAIGDIVTVRSDDIHYIPADHRIMIPVQCGPSYGHIPHTCIEPIQE